MLKKVLFIQGAGDGAHKEDAKLAESLRHALGDGYEVRYPAMPNDGDASYADLARWLGTELRAIGGPVVLVGHSVGGAVALKWLSENPGKHRVQGAFILAAPFWGGAGWRYDGYQQLELAPEHARALADQLPVFLYHCADDETVPADHLVLYQTLLPKAQASRQPAGGHQFTNDLSRIARDINTQTHG
ncbi:alpha/beta hydrolase [Zemynaea arenosa]|nr:alpha/beta fold hydrolase [Massilia arenosa]